MNRTSLSVIALAVGAVLIIGLYNVYRPQTKSMVDKVFGKIHTSLQKTNLESETPLRKGTYDGLSYSVFKNHRIEFTSGTLKDNLTPNGKHMTAYFLNSTTAPKDLAQAENVKFDDVDISHATDLGHMFAYDESLKSLDLGDNFDTSHVNSNGHGMYSLFDMDRNLTHLNLGSKFSTQNVSKAKMEDMFSGDKALVKAHNGLTGQSANDPKVKDLFNHWSNNYPNDYDPNETIQGH